MALMFLLVIWQWQLLRGSSFQTVTGKGYPPNVIKLGPLALGDVRVLHPVLHRHRVLPVGQLAIGRSSSSSASTAGTC